ncbi:MAG: hypothetical protein AB1585_13890 [Thermodesulfobacteriota bacterium]
MFKVSTEASEVATDREKTFPTLGPTPVQESADPELAYSNLSELVHFLIEGGLEKGFSNTKKIPRKTLIDRLNYLNFSEGEIAVVFRHPKYNEMVTRRIRPEPCQEYSFSGHWAAPEEYHESLRDFELLCFMIEHNREILLARSRREDINRQEVEMTLPEFGYEILLRSANRYPCRHIQAELIQGGIIFSGHLEVFSVKSFQVKLFPSDGTSLKWINPESPVQVLFKDEGEIYYSRECRIIKQWENIHSKTLILNPDQEPIHRFKRREFRAPRQVLHPSPRVSYSHPLIKKMIKLNICDLSTSGFSVEESAENSSLLPGMILPDLQIEVGNATALSCKAQVIYKNTLEPPVVKSGFTILNINNEDYINLTNLVNKSMNNHVDICGAIDPETLWQFFFQAGFIYPKKYHYIRQNKEDYKKIYEKMYRSPSEIERHITYQEKGTILGHISMLHAYDSTWMLHHFTAAPNSRYKRVALTLLQQIERYIIDSHYFESTRMDNIICYFRPENKFPNLVFGGAARALKDPQICSLERFAYLSYPMVLDSHQGGLPEPWTMFPTEAKDLEELAFFYQHHSGGQMLEALDLEPEMLGNDRLNQTYHRLGFKRERRLLTVKKNDRVKAVISLIKTDTGLNLSELTNCPTVFILEPDQFPLEIFLKVFSQLDAYDQRQMIPVLLYPMSYVERQGIAYERLYDLWVFAVKNSDHYFKYVNRLFSRLLS